MEGDIPTNRSLNRGSDSLIKALISVNRDKLDAMYKEIRQAALKAIKEGENND